MSSYLFKFVCLFFIGFNLKEESQAK